MKTDREITDRMKTIEVEDTFGFERIDLLEWLTFETAKEYLKNGVTRDEWDEARPERTDDRVRETIVSYLEFAWTKANGCRGLSAERSMHHLRAWLWLLGEDDLVEAIFPYVRYGKKQLVLVSERLGYDWKEADNGIWKNKEMGEGISAEEGMKE